jgi:flagellar biosynthesis regulator FlaF
MITNSFITADGLYHVNSYGNGWAYEITDQLTGASLWVQDEAASIVQSDTNDFQDTDPLDAYTDLFEHEE